MADEPKKPGEKKPSQLRPSLYSAPPSHSPPSLGPPAPSESSWAKVDRAHREHVERVIGLSPQNSTYEPPKLDAETVLNNAELGRYGYRTALSPPERKSMAGKFRDWTVFGVVRLVLSILAGTVIVFVLGVLAESNLRHFLEERGWDTFLTRAVAGLPAYLAHYATWLGIGLIFGAAAAIWLIWAFPHRLGDHQQLPKSQRTRWATATAAVILICGSFYLSASQPGPTTIIFHDPPTAEDIAKETAPVRAELDAIRNQLASTILERDKLRQQLSTFGRTNNAATANNSTLPPTSITGPINWHFNSQLIVISGGGPHALVDALIFQGTSTASVSIKEAYLVSGLTGRKRSLMANVQSKGAYYPVDQVDIPPAAPVQLDLTFKPELSLTDFIDQWGKFRITVIYDSGTSYVQDYDEAFVRQQLQQYVPNAFGPHVTPHDDR